MENMLRIKGSTTFDAVVADKTFGIYVNGYVTDFAVVVPNFTNVITATLTIEDEDGIVLYTKSAIAKNATTVQNGIFVPVGKNYIGRIVLSGAAGGTGGTVTVKLYTDISR